MTSYFCFDEYPSFFLSFFLCILVAIFSFTFYLFSHFLSPTNYSFLSFFFVQLLLIVLFLNFFQFLSLLFYSFRTAFILFFFLLNSFFSSSFKHWLLIARLFLSFFLVRLLLIIFFFFFLLSILVFQLLFIFIFSLHIRCFFFQLDAPNSLSSRKFKYCILISAKLCLVRQKAKWEKLKQEDCVQLILQESIFRGNLLTFKGSVRLDEHWLLL